jgi:hypothetical protein
MKTFLVSCIAALAIAVVGFFVLDGVQKPVGQAFTTTGVRL